MKTEEVYSNFCKLRQQMLSLIYLEQLLDWYSLIHNVETDTISKIIVETDKELKKLEKSNFALETVLSILESKSCFDKDVVKEAQIILDRISKSNTEPSDALIKAKIDCQRKYLIAKQKHDFNVVKDSLATVINLNKMHLNKNAYEQLVKEKIVDLSFKQVDDLFAGVKSVSLFLGAKKESVDNIGLSSNQTKFILNYLLGLLDVDVSRTEIRNYTESFMTSFGRTDVKIAINQNNQTLFAFLKNCCHEMGHALYELNNDQKYDNTFLSGAASTTFHEGVAYFYEHFVGENQNLKDYILKKIVKNDYRENLVAPTPIRIKSSSENYPIHILIRYEIEKELINGNITVNEVNDVWKQKYKEYFDIVVSDDNNGILQDPHWFNNQFAYFPSYIIGRAYAAQLHESLNKNMEISKAIKNNDFSGINNKLTDLVFKHGASSCPSKILENATGEKFNKNYYFKELER